MNIYESISSTSTMIGEIISYSDNFNFKQLPKDLPNLKLILSEMKCKIDSLLSEQCCDNINIYSTSDYLDYLKTYLKELKTQSQSWKATLKTSQEEDLKIILSKLSTLYEYLEIVPNVPKDDLFSLSPTHDRWIRLLSITEKCHADIESKIHNKYRKLLGRIATGQALAFKDKNNPPPAAKKYFMLGLGPVLYALSKKKALRKANLFYTEPSLELASQIWNMLESKMLRKLMKIVTKSIKFDKVIYVPKLATHVLESFIPFNSQEKYSTTPVDGYVMARILSTKKFGVFSKKPDIQYNKLIFHIHGGGFISMSSASHQVYTNVWCRELKVPVISIDYRLAPKHPYPAGLDDVWQAWHWLMAQGKSLGLSPDQYVIVGDSAGGNLALALTYKILSSGLSGPCGIVVAYPALNLDKNSFSPSLLHALEDLIIPHTFLKICLDAYLGDSANVNDPTVSPIHIENEILEKFPPTRIMVGNEDPLHDECFRFAEKLMMCGKDVRIAEYAGAAHGGLSYSFKGGIKETKDMVMKAAVWMKEMLGIN
ncbi:hypothetical protein SteCoe_12345 [Stentor coeruleus]|uniref:Alpha/beta hydrolase fold-3 domain-containing protein n=1 Tax=Stentor coeruleus TaxID=5963 RepID=A0A1R2CB44_9CILI|nr:hypothetical protein SteCoe_12345 [Stentor coeruleus]